MNSNKVIISVLAVGLVVLGVLAFKNPAAISVPTDLKVSLSDFGSKIPAPIVNVAAPKVTVNVPTPSPVATKLGAVPTLDGVDNPFVNIGGLRQYYYSQAMSATSSAACSIQNPFQATSTILSYTALVTANNLGSQIFDISTSSTAIASSSPAFIRAFPTGTGQFSTIWSPMGTTTSTLIGGEPFRTNGSSLVILGPTEYLTLRYATSTPGTFGAYNVGACKALIQRL